MTDFPEKISRYEVLEVLGKGAMGIVYKARDPNIDRNVAIKVVHDTEIENSPDGEELVQRFKREIQAAGLLTHSNIVTIYDGGHEDELHWIAMEYIDGPSLKSVIDDRTPLTLRDTLGLIIKICNAVNYAHRHEIIHRDIKPANILLTQDWEPKIADFGIARLASSTMTRTGVVLGTPSYMSPEQVTGGRIDHRSDIFSLGIILFEMLTTSRPFMADNPTTIMYKIVHEPPMDILDIKPDVPAELREILARALAKNPDERYQSAAQMASDIIQFINSSPDLLDSVAVGLDTETTIINAGALHGAFDSYRGIESPASRKHKSVVLPVVLSVIAILVVGIGSVALFKPDFLPSLFSGGGAAVEDNLIKEVSFLANVDDANVFIDGQEAGPADGTPIPIRRPKGTFVEVEIRKDCYNVEKRAVAVSNSDPITMNVNLVTQKRTIDLVTVPEGAKVYNGGDEIGTTPTSFEIECGQTYDLRFVAGGYREMTETIDWEAAEKQDGPFSLTLEEIGSGSIRFNGEYRVTVSTNGGRQMAANVNSLSLMPGKYTLRLTNRDVFLNMETTVDVKEGERSTIDLPALGVLSVYATPAQCEITINGFKLNHDEIPLIKRSVPAGTYHVVFQWENDRQEDTVTVVAGEEASIGKRSQANNN